MIRHDEKKVIQVEKRDGKGWGMRDSRERRKVRSVERNKRYLSGVESDRQQCHTQFHQHQLPGQRYRWPDLGKFDLWGTIRVKRR